MKMPVRFFVLSLSLAGCSNPTPPPQPASFDRPESVSFYCWDSEAREVVDFGRCAPEAPVAGEDDVGSPTDPLELIAVVTQTGTGEVAAVQLTGSDDDDTPGVIDSDVRLPGFTFAAVGEVPAAVVTPRSSPVAAAFTYVVSRGSSEIHVVGTRSFHDGLGATVRAFTPGAVLPVDSRPSAMVLTPDEQALIIALPERGEVARVPINATTGEPEPAELLVLGTTIPAPVDLSALTPADLPADYTKTCGSPELIDLTPVAPRAPFPAGAAPMPWALEVDAENGTVLVADRALPIIHVIDLATMTELAPISVSVPTRELALTPRVPATIADIDPTAATAERFLYAIDETDKSVLVVDYSDPARASFGGVLTVAAVGTPDRLSIPEHASNAIALEVVTPAYSETEPVVLCTDSAESSPLQLHGVFLAVATLDGLVRFFDIFDRDQTCRGTACFMGADADDDIVAIRRHQPRIGHFVVEPVGVTNEPSWQVAQTTGAALQEDGTSSSPLEFPTLVPMMMCPATLAQVFPSEATTEALVCAVADPFAARQQNIVMQYEGTIPGTVTSGANFDPTGTSIEVRFDPCELGILGSENDLGTGSLASYAGDWLTVTGELPPVLNDDMRTTCAALFNETDAGEITPVRFQILRAFSGGGRPTYRGRLEIAPVSMEGPMITHLQECFPELLEIEVRVGNAMLVSSSIDGFLHPVVADATDGSCTVDDTLDAAFQRGRALFDQTFQAPYVAFTLGPEPPGILSLDRAALGFTIGDVPGPLSLNPSADQSGDVPSLLAELEYNDVDERLYVVDQSTSGLVRVRLTNLGIQGRFR